MQETLEAHLDQAFWISLQYHSIGRDCQFRGRLLPWGDWIRSGRRYDLDEGALPTPFESAQLNLQLFDLRREPVLREARTWFLNDFNPESVAELVALVSGERNASFRMVLGYWDMAVSLVSTGAIDADAFRAAHGEIFATFSKIQPFLAELRTVSGEPDICKHVEAVVVSTPDAAAILTRRREAWRAAAKARGTTPLASRL